MATTIKIGETNADRKTVFFEIYTSDGLLASGGADANYEGTLAVAAGATLEVENNLLGWTAKAGTFGHHGDGEFYYTFANAEVAVGQVEGTIAFRFQKTGFRNVVARVPLLATNISALETKIDAIKAKTDNLPSDPADASDIAASFTATATLIAAVSSALIDIGGLMHRNSMADNFTYDVTTGEMLTCRVRVFANAAALVAAVAGHVDNADGEVRRYTMTGTLLSGKLETFKARQVL